MTNQTEKPKKLPGDTMIGVGAALAILGVIVVVVGGANGGTGGGTGMLGLVLGFGLAVIGYLQRIAAKK